MNQPKRIFSFLSIMLIVLCGASTFFAQADPNLRPEQSYEAVLQVVLGVNDASVKTDIPQNLSTISKQLRDNYSFPSYRLANTFIGRVTNNGTLEHDFSIIEFPTSGPSSSEGGMDHDMGEMAETPDLHVAAAVGQSATLEFTPSKAGTYEFFCTVAGHKEAGMVGTLVVTAP